MSTFLCLSVDKNLLTCINYYLISPSFLLLTHSPFQFDTVPDTTGFSNSVTLKGFTMKTEVKISSLKSLKTHTKKKVYLSFSPPTRTCWRLNVSPSASCLLRVSWASSAWTPWGAASARWWMGSPSQPMTKRGTQTFLAMTVGWWETPKTYAEPVPHSKFKYFLRGKNLFDFLCLKKIERKS